MQHMAAPHKSIKRSSNLFVGLSLAIIILLYILSTEAFGSILHHPKLQMFKMMFLSIMIEAMPFILIGVVLSALVEVFVSEQTIRRMIPKNPILGIITASVLGIIFPLCECGMVPAVRRLIQKGMPVYVATTFIIVGPILNPIVFWSTFTAFRNKPEIVYSRMGLAFAVALLVGLIVHRIVKTNPLKGSESAAAHSQDAGHHHNHGTNQRSVFNKLVEVMRHSISEFFEMGKYLMFGAMLVGLLQTFVSKGSMIELGHGVGSSNLLMMGFGIILSLCSTSDAFVAQSFITTFSQGSLVAFMVLGPMLNLKGILMMSAVFKPRFVVLYSSLVILFVYVGTLLLEQFVLK
ncbi:permease [Paenibacillus terrigena]|uniref:permease n=1 Tax=Paenibacillus terrigena TaxID=369333 RepID=UPI0028D69682|nr:permease [Paenibacillus terrigena]